MWRPSDFGISQILESIKKLPKIGFIISLRKEYSEHDIVKNASLKNVLLKEFVPQKAILNDPRVIAFVSHGGGSSIIEGLYYGKVIIGFPLASDQDGGIYRVERLGCGINLGPNPVSKEISEAIEKVIFN